MSLKGTLLTIAIVMLLLLPIGQTLRDNNPLTCSAFTSEESSFAQAASNWSEGKGYRMAEGRPFDPLITVGIPMAWGASVIHGWTDEDIANSGRIFTFACFLLLLFILGRSAYRIDRSWIAVPIAIGIFGYGLSQVPYGPSFTFGFLGEMLGFALAALAYRALDDRNFLRAGLLAVAVFAMKPTFVFFLPAVGLAAILHSGKAAFRVLISMGIAIGILFYQIAEIRNESIADYISTFFQQSSQIARSSPPGSPLDLYADFKSVPAIFSMLFLLFGGYATARARKMAPSQIAAFFLFLSTILYFLIIGQRPGEKQWSALFCLTLVGFSVPWGTLVGARFTGWMPREFTRAIFLTVLATAFFSVGHGVLRKFKDTPEAACASKEQSAINEVLRSKANLGEVTKENFGAWIQTESYRMSIYRLPWTIPYQKDWKAFGSTLPKWLFGETRHLFPSPEGCTPEFYGETFALLRCEKMEVRKPSVRPRPRGKA